MRLFVCRLFQGLRSKYKFSRGVGGQAALEFLTTYAWAFLVILITVGALYYFGIFDFQKFLPQECTFSAQFECVDFRLEGSTDLVRFQLVNNLGEDIHVNKYELTNDGQTCNSTLSIDWAAEQAHDFAVPICKNNAFNTDERADVTIALQYYAVNTPSQPNHWTRGKINAVIS